jgi:hypothetical protein
VKTGEALLEMETDTLNVEIESPDDGFLKRSKCKEWITRPFPDVLRAIMLKDVKTFLRDTTQWSQLFLLVALVVVYRGNTVRFDSVVAIIAKDG